MISLRVIQLIGRLALIALVAAGVACEKGPCGKTPNELAGSVSSTYDIVVDSVRAKRVDQTAVTIEFAHGNDIVAKIVVDTSSYAKGAAIPLVDGDVYRVTSPSTDFPDDIERGQITFETELTNGQPIEGCFAVTFNMENGEQRTLDGAFSAPLEDIDS
ncbi:MAG: hypothetical protein HY791_37735 [Deltaproteobacteria bacterium]|nr:hypothetical protein [Deltaproteobacteria bacterium]